MTIPSTRAGTPHTIRRAWLPVASGVALAAAALAAATRPTASLSPFAAVILGAVEGVTEFLPISSTGHLLVAERLLGLGSGTGKTAADTYAVAIQLGAIQAVIGIYRRRIATMVRGLLGRDPSGLRLVKLLVVAFLPAAAIGFALDNTIKEHLFGPWPVIAAWVVGGLFLLAWRPGTGRVPLEQVGYRQAASIGAAQVLALWPGTSRSLVTIVAALGVGLTISAAVEFSFLLGLITLSAATTLDLVKNGHELFRQFGLATPLLGAIVAGLTATIAVRWFVQYLRTGPMTMFGWYRLAAAAAAVVLVITNRV